MFCSKCGKQMEDGSKFCPDCGEAVASVISPGTSKAPAANSSLQQGGGNSMPFDVKTDGRGMPFDGKTDGRGMSFDAKTDGKGMSFDMKTKGGNRKKWLISIAVAIAVLAVIFILGAFFGKSDEEELISKVQNAYLGNYKTVTLKEVLEFSFAGGEWGAGEAKNGEYYIVEYRGKDDIGTFVFQFSLSGMDVDTFQLSGMMVLGNDCSGWSAYSIKTYLDMLYEAYAEEYPNKGIIVDESTSNDTLKGHIR